VTDKLRSYRRVTSERQKWLNRFAGQRSCARQRRIEFELSFGQWFGIWAASGHMHERGCRHGQYVMARLGDQGSYKSGNVKIITMEENWYEQRMLLLASRRLRSGSARDCGLACAVLSLPA
jgi:hypothetical protein